jgi:hypothetical protein
LSAPKRSKLPNQFGAATRSINFTSGHVLGLAAGRRRKISFEGLDSVFPAVRPSVLTAWFAQ